MKMKLLWFKNENIARALVFKISYLNIQWKVINIGYKLH